MTDHIEDAPNEILAAAKEAKDHAVAAAEAAVGLAIVISLFRLRESVNPDVFTTLKW